MHKKDINIFENKKAVIFDMDGVLFDTNKGHEEAFIDTLKNIHENFDYKEYFGMSTLDTLKKFLNNEKMIEKLKREKQEKTLEYLDLVELYPYSLNLLKLLKINKYKIVLATSGSRDRTIGLLEKENIKDYFNFVITADDVKDGKPSPEIYNKAIELLETEKEDTLVIEDSPNGVEAAKKANLDVIALGHNHKYEELANANFIIRDMQSLYSIFSYILSNRDSILKGTEMKKIVSIIPAAGKGTRLGFDKPKILYPIAGTTPLEILYNKLKPLSEKIILVTNPESINYIDEYIKIRGIDIETKVIDNSIGNADTILSSEEIFSGSNDALIIWGDQIGFNKDSLRDIISEHQNSNADMSIPVTLRKEPYIHFERDEEGKIIKILRRRLSDKMPDFGENDAGVFIIKKEKLYPALKKMKEDYLKKGENNLQGKEFDFLDIIPIISHEGKVITNSSITEEDSIGMNDISEFKFHENRINNKNNNIYY